jgi:predicted dehydrogenase
LHEQAFPRFRPDLRQESAMPFPLPQPNQIHGPVALRCQRHLGRNRPSPSLDGAGLVAVRRWRDRSTGGGILQDHIPHYVDLWRWWTGAEVESVCAEVQHIARDHLESPEIGQWEDFGTVLMRFTNGAVAVFNTGTVGRDLSPIQHLGSGVGEWSDFGYLYGTRGQLTFDFFPWDSPENGR